jgi:regulation of enolase protein 1 (concanavalin A-like superfamily)
MFLGVMVLLASPMQAETTVRPLDQWINADIGTIPAVGSGSYQSTSATYTLSGSGADIWGTADNFHYSYQPLQGDGVIVARVESLVNTHLDAKAGIMLRESVAPGSKYVAMLVTPRPWCGMQYRPTTGGFTFNSGALGLPAPRWLKIERRGRLITGYQSVDGVSWTLVQSVNLPMEANLLVGLAACSHMTTAQLTTAVINQVSLTPTTVANALPWPWTETSIGQSTDQGVALFDGSFVLANLGANITATADRFKFVNRTLVGDGTLVVKVGSNGSADNLSRFGLMMRESFDANAKNVLLSITTGKSLEFLSRQTVGGTTAWRAASVTKAPPVWIKLTRSGNSFTASYSDDGSVWTVQGSESIAIGASIQVGLAYSNRSTSIWAFGSGDQLKLVTSLDADGNGLADAWESNYFGYLGVDPTADADDDGLTNGQEWELGTNPVIVTSTIQQPSLTLISGNNQLASTGAVLAQPLTVKVADASTGAPLAGVLVAYQVTQGKGFFGSGANAPATLSLVSGNDGVVQTPFQFSTVAGATVVSATVGNQSAGQVTFNLNAQLGAPGTDIQLNAADIGAVKLPGVIQYQNGVYTLSASSGDIYGSADSFSYASRTLPGDRLVVVRLASLSAANSWAKAGLMIRESLAANARAIAILATPGNGVFFQWRDLANGATTTVNRSGLTAPKWLALRRSGSTIAGYYSDDARTWTLVGSRTWVAPQPVYAGLALSTNSSGVGQATFDSLSIAPLAPSPWQLADIGNFLAGNIDEFTATQLLVRAGGTDIKGTTDSFRYLYQPLVSDGQQTVRVAAQSVTSPTAKSGVMIRETTAANARYVLLAQTPGTGIVLQTRAATAAMASTVTSRTGVIAPSSLKLERAGRYVNASFSTDGQTWITIGQIDWGFAPSLIGLATSSLNNSTSTETVYDNTATSIFAGQQGWSAAYFPNAALVGPPALLRRDASIDFAWPARVIPVPGLGGGNYSISWQGRVQPPTDGACTFTVVTTGGVRLRVNGQTVIDRWAVPATTTTEVSGAVSLRNGEPALVELDYVNGSADGRIQLRWTNATQVNAVLPPEAVQPTDADNDGLPDVWEAAHGLNSWDSADASLVPDGDNLPYLAKFQLGLSLGQKADRVLGGVIGEEWLNLPGSNVADLTNSPRFPGSPDIRSLLPTLETISNHADNYGQRLRGYLVAPRDGVYQFWIAADDRAELWLSPSESPFDRVKIASVNSSTTPRSYDGQPSQKSVPLTLQAGHYYFEVLHKEGPGSDNLSVAWTRPGATRTVIEGAFLATFAPCADDLRGDGLPESWRAAHGFDVGQPYGIHGAHGDRDGDKLSNLLEYQTGTRPDIIDTDGDGATDLGELTLGTNPLVADPNTLGGVPAPWLMGSIGSRSLVQGGQLNGLVALWTDATAFSGVSDAGGILYQNVFGDFTLSGTVGLDKMAQADLEGGLMVRATLAVNAPFIALTRGRQGGWTLRYREFADGRVLLVQLTGALLPQLSQVAVKRVGNMVSLYAQTGSGASRKLADYPLNLGNADVVVGFVGWGPTAGTFAVRDIRLRQAASFAVNPANPNSPPTGLAEFDSAKWMGEWDGLAAPNSIGASHVPVLSEIAAIGGRLSPVWVKAGSAAVNRVGPWATKGGALVAQDRRGELTWQVNVPDASVYLLELSIREAYAAKPETSHFPLKLWVDGQYVDTKVLSATATQPSSALWFSPWLPAGAHTIRVQWDGAQDYTQLQVETLGLYKIEDEDSDANGVADWIDRRLQLFNGLDAASTSITSAISPLPLEGRARWPELATLTAAGLPVPVFAGAGYRWFADVPLVRGVTTPIVFFGENGGVQSQLSVQWSPHDALAGGALQMKTGSKLLIAVVAGPGETASLSLAGVAVPLVDGVAEVSFPLAGTYRLLARVSGPQGVREADTVVTVYAPPSLPLKLPGLLTRERIMTRPTLAAGVVLEADPRLNLTGVLGSTTKMAWEADDNVDRRMVARIGTNGPILTATDAPGTAIYATMETYTRLVKTYPDGTTENETLFIMSPVRPDHAIRIEIFVAGVVFSDGTRVKTLTPADLDNLGQARVLFLRPPNATTSICHRTMLTYQGAVIGTE